MRGTGGTTGTEGMTTPAGTRVTGTTETSLKQQLEDKLIEHRQYTGKHGEDLPEIRNWTWGPSPRLRSTEGHNR